MFKENGMFKSSNKKEFSNLKSKKMICNSCKKIFTLDKIKFGDTKCSECGGDLTDYKVR